MPENRGIFTRPNLEAYLGEEPAVDVTPLADGLWTARIGDYRTVFASVGEGVVAFDTFGTPGRARAYRSAIERTLPGQPIAAVVYTHDHLDHAGFSADFAPGAEIIADEMCAKVIELRAAQGQLAPTRTISGRDNSLTIAGVALQLVNPGPTHGTGNLSAYFADHKILFSSDTVLSNARYGLMPDYHIANFVRYMRELGELDFDIFVPGRFDVCDKARFHEGCDYIEAIQTACQQAFVEMVPIWVHDMMADYCRAALGERFGHLDGFDAHIGQTAIRIVHHYLMGGWGLEDTPEPALLLAGDV